MKLSKLVARAAVALLLGAGVVAIGGGMSASAAGHPGDHRPPVCKLAAIPGSPALDPTGLCPQFDPRTGAPVINWDPAMYKYYDDISPYAPLADPLKFPKSDGGLNCALQNDGVLQCWRYVNATATAGRDDCSLAQLKDPSSFACRGSVMTAIFERDESTAPGGARMCTPETIYYGRGANGVPRYLSQAMQCYDSVGLPTVPLVVGYKNDGKGKSHVGTMLGTTKGYLTAASASDALAEAPATVTTTSTITPGQLSTPGTRADYTLTVRAESAGSAIVSVGRNGLDGTAEDTIPSNWIRFTSVSAEEMTYLIPHLSAGEVATASLNFRVTGFRTPGVTATVNDSSSHSEIAVVPEAPVCTTPDTADGNPIAVGGSQPTVLEGLHCSVASDSTLDVWVPAGRDIKKLSVSGDQIRYVPANEAFRGEETLYLMARNEGGIASAPIPITVNVVDKAAPVDDEYTVKMEERTTLDAAHGLMANDAFPGGADAWTVVSNGVEADGAIRIGEHGELTIEPGRHFSGDLTFEYKLAAAHGQGTDTATVTIHVVE